MASQALDLVRSLVDTAQQAATSRPRGKQIHGLIAQAIDLIFLPLRVAVSPLARRAYLSTFLLFVTSFALLFLSTLAYVLFYWAYIPHAAVSVPIYLQYSHGAPVSGDGSVPVSRPAAHPFGTALLTPSLSSNQKYDVEVVLDMPRSPVNKRVGNFMVEVALMAPSGVSATPSEEMGATRAAAAMQFAGGQFGDISPDAVQETETVVVRARRPALMPYTSLHVALVRQAAALPWYAFGLREERETLSIGMLEDVEFAASRTRRLRGGSPGVPDRVRVTLESRELLEVYSAHVEIRARLRGLRWLMYKHWLFSFVVFVGGFFGATMGSTVAVYVFLTVRQIMQENEKMQAIEDADSDVKDEAGEMTEDGLSDTSRQFPTGHGKEPLKYSGRGRLIERDDGVVIKQEDFDAGSSLMRAAEADDEGDGDDYEDAGAESFRDSGIGTGREDRAAAALARRRKRTSGASGDDGWDGRGRMPGL